jgi:HAD superfamily hydrolase (TIGR01549 family)
MPLKKKLVIFDLDGVLVNSLDNMRATWKKVCKKFNLKIPFSSYEKNIGLPFLKILQNLKIKNHTIEIKKYYTRTSKINLSKIKIYPRTKKTLSIISRNNKIAIFTSKDKIRTNLILKRIGIKFDYVVTPESVRRGKPNPEGINKIIKTLKFKKKNSIFIGDSFQDFLAAKKAQILFLYAEWGYGKLKLKSKRITKIQDVLGYL